MTDPHRERRLNQVDPHADGSQSLDVGQRFCFAWSSGKHSVGIVVKGLGLGGLDSTSKDHHDGEYEFCCHVVWMRKVVVVS